MYSDNFINELKQFGCIYDICPYCNMGHFIYINKDVDAVRCKIFKPVFIPEIRYLGEDCFGLRTYYTKSKDAAFKFFLKFYNEKSCEGFLKYSLDGYVIIFL